MNHSLFVETLLTWGMPRLRDLPWRNTRDPWAVLVSEVMAQQTQVSRVIPKYLAFMREYPTPTACADAPLANLLTLWSGLGYPRRCKNLHDAARAMVQSHHGEVPRNLDELLALPGVGPYTARAVLAFAAAQDVAVVDTNVARVLARVTNQPLTARASQDLADHVLPRGQSWEWNQVLMDFGAQVCTARRPQCGECPIRTHCAWNVECSGETPAVGIAHASNDPARSSALTSRPQARFEGSDRQARGLLMKTLAERGVKQQDVARVMNLNGDTRRAGRLLESLVNDGLVVVRDGWCRLP
ncbi:MAG: A/G-specific adenine glycosylase [Ilumatobacteraceae bacterium]|nr:A/G-specific adenine glycosylase [Ilumatobacteraceae bacterium]